MRMTETEEGSVKLLGWNGMGATCQLRGSHPTSLGNTRHCADRSSEFINLHLSGQQDQFSRQGAIITRSFVALSSLMEISP
jgi:hypothetical protein